MIIHNGKGPLVYEIEFCQIHQPVRDGMIRSDDDWDAWKYALRIAPVDDKYYLGDNGTGWEFVADTKEGLIRDLAIFLHDEMGGHGIEGMPPPPTLDNMLVEDETPDGAFMDIDMKSLVKNRRMLASSEAPPGEPIYDIFLHGAEGRKRKYDIQAEFNDGVVEYGQFMNNGGQYETDDDFFSRISARDVPKTIKAYLEARSKKAERIHVPTRSNVKIANFTRNRQFAPEILLAAVIPSARMQQTKIAKVKMQTAAVPQPTIQSIYANTSPTPVTIPVAPKAQTIKSPKKRMKYERKERLRA